MPNEIELYSLLNLKRDKKPDMIVIGVQECSYTTTAHGKKARSNANNSSAVKTGPSLTSKASIAKIQNRKNRSNSFGVEDHFLIYLGKGIPFVQKNWSYGQANESDRDLCSQSLNASVIPSLLLESMP